MFHSSKEVSVFPWNIHSIRVSRTFQGRLGKFFLVMLLPSIALIEVYHPCPWIIPIHKVLFTTNLLLQSICWMKAKLCHCCVTGWCGGHVLQLTHYFLRIVRDKILCQRETPLWKRWRRGWYSFLRLMTASEAWTNFTKAVIFFFLWPPNLAPARIFIFTGELSISLICFGWRTIFMVQVKYGNWSWNILSFHKKSSLHIFWRLCFSYFPV